MITEFCFNSIPIRGLQLARMKKTFCPPEETFISDFGVFNLYYGIYFFFFSVFFSPLLQFIKVNNTNLQLIGHRNILKIFVVFLIVNALILYLVFKIKYNNSPVTFLIVITGY